MTREDFINKLVPAAKELGTTYDILPSLILGVACHESNFGDSTLAEQGNNLFGVKGTFQGASVKLPTWEVENGERVNIEANFRKYPSFFESLQDFCKLITYGVSWNPAIYHSVVGVKDWKEVIERFAETPYMTDPDYFKKLYNITDQYRLFQYNEDSPELEPVPEAPEEEPEAAETIPQPVPEPEAAEPEAAEPEAPEAAGENEQAPEGVQYIEYPKTLFKLGSKGNYVQMIQEQIGHGLEVDGLFGSVTAAFVTVFQAKNDLVPDGIVGEATWHVLFNH